MSENEQTEEGLEGVQEKETGLGVGIAIHPITGRPNVALQIVRNGETQNILMSAEEAHQTGNLLTLNGTLVLTMQQTAGMVQQMVAQQNSPKIHLPR